MQHLGGLRPLQNYHVKSPKMSFRKLSNQISKNSLNISYLRCKNTPSLNHLGQNYHSVVTVKEDKPIVSGVELNIV